MRKIMLGLVVLGFVMWLGTSRQPKPPELAASCTTAAFKLSTETIEKPKAVAFRIVGIEGRRYTLGFDTATFQRTTDGGWDAVAKPGRDGSVLVLADAKPMKGCTRTGLFATPVPAGDHTVTLYELTDDGALFLDEQEIEVTE